MLAIISCMGVQKPRGNAGVAVERQEGKNSLCHESRTKKKKKRRRTTIVHFIVFIMYT